MVRWTSVSSLGKDHRVVTPDGSTVTVSNTEASTLKVGGKEVPTVTVSGTREDTGTEYKGTALAGDRWKKI